MRIQRAKKSLGQHFLKSHKALSDIIDAGDIEALDIVLEIGPGKGVLTEKLLFFAGKVIAVEKDRELVLYLKEKFQKEIASGKLDLIEGDIMEFDQTILSFYEFDYKVIANIPYNITGEILRKFLSGKHQPERMVLLIQKEVAERIVARPLVKHKKKEANESILSLSVKAYGKPIVISKVPARYFSPAPKVDSAIILIENISRKHFEHTSEEFYFLAVKAGFSHKRKLLIRNLGPLASKDELKKAFNSLDIPFTARAETVPIEKWLMLSEFLHKK